MYRIVCINFIGLHVLVCIPPIMRKILKLFLRNERGAVAIMFGLALVPLVVLIAAAVEYSRAGDAHSRLQAAVDSTALALSKLPATTTATELTNQADKMVKAYIIGTQLTALRVSK